MGRAKCNLAPPELHTHTQIPINIHHTSFSRSTVVPFASSTSPTTFSRDSSPRAPLRAPSLSPRAVSLFPLPTPPRRPSHPVHAHDSIIRAHAPLFTVFKIFFVVFASANGRAIAAVGRIAPPPGPSESSSSSFFGVFSRLSLLGVFSDDPMTRSSIDRARPRVDVSRRADVRARRGRRIALNCTNECMAEARMGRCPLGF